MPLLEPLSPEQRTTLLVVSLDVKALRKLVGRLGTAPTGVRLDKLSSWELAWSLVDFYGSDAEVARDVDRTLRREVGDSPLAAAVGAEGGGRAIAWLLLESPDPARDLAWALLGWEAGGDEASELARRCVETIVAEFDAAEEKAKAQEAGDAAATAAPGGEEATGPAPVEPGRELRREAQRARTERDRARSRLEGTKERLVEVEAGLAETRRLLHIAEGERVRAEGERDRLEKDREELRSRLAHGTAAEVERLGAERDAERRRVRSLEEDLEESRRQETELGRRVRELEERRPAAAVSEEGSGAAPAAGEGAAWSLPVFTDEFYESIRRWDRKVVRNAFEKVARLADDWRHPSLRAIPLEGLPGVYRIRVATDVRLIYRMLDGNRIEVLSLIDREDLTRYIRQAK